MLPNKVKAGTFSLSCLLWLMLFSLCLAAPARAEMEEFPVVKLQSLDKATARTMTFEVKVGDTVKFGPLYIKPRTCRKAPPIEKPEAAAFLQIWETVEKAEWVFSGWMFASSPSLSSMDHPIYDVWVLDCLGDVIAAEDNFPAPSDEEDSEKEVAEDQTDVPASDPVPAPEELLQDD